MERRNKSREDGMQLLRINRVMLKPRNSREGRARGSKYVETDA